MPRGYRCIIVALVGCLIGPPALAKNQRGNAAGEQLQTSALQPVAKVQPDTAGADQPSKHCLGTARPELTCEAISAEAAIEQTAIAREQARVSGRQTTLGLLTLLAAIAAAIFAERAAHYTKGSARAARQSNEINQATYRAWVVCENIVLAAPVSFASVANSPQEYEFSFSAVLKNTGPALARKTFLHIRLLSMKSDTFEPALAGVADEADQVISTYGALAHRGLPIAPGQTVSLKFAFGGPGGDLPTLDQIRGGAFFLLGHIRYEDHHGAVQRNIFAFHPDADSVRPWNFMTMVRAGAIGDAT